MEVVAGAMSPLLGKLGELLKDEFNLGKKVKRGIMSLKTELTMMHAALCKVADMPPEQLDEQVKIWANMVRELSYDMEDAVDASMVHMEKGSDQPIADASLKSRVNKFLKKSAGLCRKGKDLHQIASAIKEALEAAKQLGELRQRYELEMYGGNACTTIDPRVVALYKDVRELVGIEQPTDELIQSLFYGEEAKQRLRTISIVGFGGLGKTTLAKAVYDKIKAQFDCTAFVSVSRNPNVKKIFQNLLYDLDREKYKEIYREEWDEVQLIDELRRFLQDKRYLVVIDDIWDEKVWKFIKCAIPINHLGSRLIMTTRKSSVAEACCSSTDDIAYRMKHLSDVDSQRLFYKRIFSHEDGCPHELERVSQDILKKCGGVPLAIISIASLLSRSNQVKTNDQWHMLLNSIGHGLAEGDSVEEMQKILSFSYYDLPSHMKTCLLYLSIFPEDYEIPRDQLIWKWIAEGFVKCEKLETRLFESGENYFNELINRSLIQPIDIDVEGKAQSCRVHDMVLDLILNLASGENFITIFDGIPGKTSLQRKVRRLALQNTVVQPTMPQLTMGLSQVRSITVFRHAINLMPPLPSFHVLRLLDIEDCELHNLRYVGNLTHLRYLRLRAKNYPKKDVELPAEIGNLRFLQTVDIKVVNIEELLSNIIQLRQLMCIHVGHNTRLPDGIGNLTYLEVLSTVCLNKCPSFAKQLQSLTTLRELSILTYGMDESLIETLVNSLCKLQKIETLEVRDLSPLLDLFGNCWVPPPKLRRFLAFGHFDAMPAFIKRDPLLLFNLSVLNIQFSELPQEDLQYLGRLIISSCGPKFQRGAMPKVEDIEFRFDVRQKKDDNADFDFGLGNLLSLEHIDVAVYCYDATKGEVEEAEAALEHTTHVHPNHPILSTKRVGEDRMRDHERD
uniref:NB-ARC domain-containing protein n=1 Tax=Leersia perrieri TaxID=77586 RepID=A0A0D9XRY5_9ORYZ